MSRSILLLVIAAFVSLNSLAQDIRNPVPNISIEKIRYLFIGIDNPLMITTGCDDKYSISISKGTVIDKGDGHFLVRPGDTSEVIIKLKSDKKEFDFLFHVRSIPDPEIYVGNYKNQDPVLAFKSAAGVRAIVENFYYETQFNVVSFDIEFSGEGFDEVSKHTNEGARWDETTKKAINKMVKGTMVYINNVRVLGPDGRVRRINDDYGVIQR